MPHGLGHLVRDFQERTIDYWIEWVRYLSVPFEWQEAVIRAAITLEALQFRGDRRHRGGAHHLDPRGRRIPQRNWDYRSCWLRDAYFVVQALNRLGATKTMEGFLGYITTVVAREADRRPEAGLRHRPRPAPGRDRGADARQAIAAWVRSGSAIWRQEQVQNDSYGSIILAAAQMFFDRRLPRARRLDLFEPPRTAGREGRGASPSSPMPASGNFAAARRSIPIRRCSAGRPATAWPRSPPASASRSARSAGAAKPIASARPSSSRRWNRRSDSFVTVFGGETADASLLLLQEVGLVSAADPRFVSTLTHITGALRRGDHLFRYSMRPTISACRRPPSPSAPSGTSTRSPPSAARRGPRELFEGMLARRNHVGLLSEDIDPKTGELWGNFPQTYSHGRPHRLAPCGCRRAGRRHFGAAGDRLQPRRPAPRDAGAGGRAGRGAPRRDAASRRACGSAGAARRRRERPRTPELADGGQDHLCHHRPRREDYQDFYIGFANGVLWPMFHYRVPASSISAGTSLRRLSCASTQSSRRQLAPLLQPDDLIWVHDYHFMSAGRRVCATWACATASASSCTSPFPCPSCC